MKTAKVSKKAIMVLVVSAIAVSSLFAGVGVGLNAVIGSSVGSVRTGEYKDTYGATDSLLNTVYGIKADVQIDLNIGGLPFFVRPEVQVLFNNGVGNGFRFTFDDRNVGVSTSSDNRISITTVDIAALFGYRSAMTDKVTMEYFVGAYASLPVAGKVATTETYSTKMAAANFGALAGVDAAMKAGVGEVVLGARFMFDLTSTKVEISGTEQNLYARSAIAATAGYRLSF